MWALEQRGLVADAMGIVHVNGSQATSMVCSTQSNCRYVRMRYEHVRDGMYERVCMCVTLRPESLSGLTYKSSPSPLNWKHFVPRQGPGNNIIVIQIYSLLQTISIPLG